MLRKFIKTVRRYFRSKDDDLWDEWVVILIHEQEAYRIADYEGYQSYGERLVWAMFGHDDSQASFDKKLESAAIDGVTIGRYYTVPKRFFDSTCNCDDYGTAVAELN